MDLDLDRLIGLFDEALTSEDPRVKNALQNLLMMVVLTQGDKPSIGPLTEMRDHMHNLSRRVERIEIEIKRDQADRYDRQQYTRGFQAPATNWERDYYNNSIKDILAYDWQKKINGGKI